MDRFHELDSKTEFGSLQARFGPRENVASCYMKPITDKDLQEAINHLLDIVADNVKALLASRLSDSPNKAQALNQKTDIGVTTIRRLLRGSKKAESGEEPTAANIETLMRIAYYFNEPVWTLLVDPKTKKRANDASLAPTIKAVEVQPRDLKSRRNRPPTK